MEGFKLGIHQFDPFSDDRLMVGIGWTKLRLSSSPTLLARGLQFRTRTALRRRGGSKGWLFSGKAAWNAMRLANGDGHWMPLVFWRIPKQWPLEPWHSGKFEAALPFAGRHGETQRARPDRRPFGSAARLKELLTSDDKCVSGDLDFF